MPPAARVTDMHVCPMVTVLVPHVGGPILPPGAPTVLIGFLPAATVTNMAVCVGPPDVIIKGSAGVFINFLPAARMGDQTVHGGVIILGCPTVIIGEIGSPSPGAGGMGGVAAGLAAAGVTAPQASSALTALLSTEAAAGTPPPAQSDPAPAKAPAAAATPKTLQYQPSSGAKLVAEPDKATTLLGRWNDDMQSIKAELKPPESTDLGCAPGEFNFLNVPSAIADPLKPEEFFERYNKPWLDAAIQRGDKILICTPPTLEQRVNAVTGKATTFGREMEHLEKSGYQFDPATGSMKKK